MISSFVNFPLIKNLEQRFDQDFYSDKLKTKLQTIIRNLTQISIDQDLFALDGKDIKQITGDDRCAFINKGLQQAHTYFSLQGRAAVDNTLVLLTTRNFGDLVGFAQYGYIEATVLWSHLSIDLVDPSIRPAEEKKINDANAMATKSSQKKFSLFFQYCFLKTKEEAQISSKKHSDHQLRLKLYNAACDGNLIKVNKLLATFPDITKNIRLTYKTLYAALDANSSEITISILKKTANLHKTVKIDLYKIARKKELDQVATFLLEDIIEIYLNALQCEKVEKLPEFDLEDAFDFALDQGCDGSLVKMLDLNEEIQNPFITQKDKVILLKKALSKNCPKTFDELFNKRNVVRGNINWVSILVDSFDYENQGRIENILQKTSFRKVRDYHLVLCKAILSNNQQMIHRFWEHPFKDKLDEEQLVIVLNVSSNMQNIEMCKNVIAHPKSADIPINEWNMAVKFSLKRKNNEIFCMLFSEISKRFPIDSSDTLEEAFITAGFQENIPMLKAVFSYEDATTPITRKAIYDITRHAVASANIDQTALLLHKKGKNLSSEQRFNLIYSAIMFGYKGIVKLLLFYDLVKDIPDEKLQELIDLAKRKKYDDILALFAPVMQKTLSKFSTLTESERKV